MLIKAYKKWKAKRILSSTIKEMVKAKVKLQDTVKLFEEEPQNITKASIKEWAEVQHNAEMIQDRIARIEQLKKELFTDRSKD